MERPGGRPGDRYLRYERTHHGRFVLTGHGQMEATSEADLPQAGAGRTLARLRRSLLGRPLPTQALETERLSSVRALPILSSDALSSMAYGPEAGLAILATAGAGALAINVPIGIAIAALMALVVTSYRQVVAGYPHGGGSYAAARQHLGVTFGLVAAGALLVDYVLTVSVSVSSGVDALVSAFGGLAALKVGLGLVFIALIVLGNLRGVREAGAIFAFPTYAFVLSFVCLIGVGLVRALLFGAAHHPVGHFPPIAGARAAVTPLLILTAFASGSSSMTGIEAVSNSVPSFQPPEVRNAQRTLVRLGVILVVLFLGVDLLDLLYGAEPHLSGSPTVVAELARSIFVGAGGWFFYVVQFSTTLVLILAANTSFNGFPRLAAILARDDHLPHRFAHLGSRLVYSTAIVFLAASAAVLLVVFGGSTDALINLYALGVFTAFTLAQAAMVRHWVRDRGRNWRRNVVINGVGALTTLLVDGIIIVTKTPRGAWVVLILIPLLVAVFTAIHRHYRSIAQRLRAVETVPVPPLPLGPVVVVSGLTRAHGAATQRAMAYAGVLGPRVVVCDLERRGLGARARLATLWRTLDRLQLEEPGRVLTVVLPEATLRRGWVDLARRPLLLIVKLRLLRRPGVVAASVPAPSDAAPADPGEERARGLAGLTAGVPTHHVAMVPIARLDPMAARALQYASQIAREVIPIHVSAGEEEEAVDAAGLESARFRAAWGTFLARIPAEELPQGLEPIIIASPFRSVTDPLLAYIDAWRQIHPGPLCTVVLPELVVPRWWRQPLHNHRAFAVKRTLLRRADIAVADVPYLLAAAPVPAAGPGGAPRPGPG
ncbi:MAG TPA: APC family permease [Candidatus Micrarchaeia archaeon]|nr:APC family permease [Candidatus Micrarchaeia archaeon]